MKQLGLLEGSNVLGDEVKRAKPDRFKTARGQLRSIAKKAIKWYVEENELTLTATGAYPMITFRMSDDQDKSVAISEIVEDYEARDRRNRNA